MFGEFSFSPSVIKCIQVSFRLCTKHSICSTLRKPSASGQWHLRDLVVGLNFNIWTYLTCCLGANPWDSRFSQPLVNHQKTSYFRQFKVQESHLPQGLQAHGPFARVFQWTHVFLQILLNSLPFQCQTNQKVFKGILQSTFLWEAIGCGTYSSGADNRYISKIH